MTKSAQICENLSRAFAAKGFAEPSVDELRDAADVSLRTLYKYFPSRTAMVVGALEHRNQVYLSYISGGPDAGQAHVLHVFERLGAWLAEGSNHGCLLLVALASYPDEPEIHAIAEYHKLEVRSVLHRRLTHVFCGEAVEDLADALMTIHEGQTHMAMTLGPEAATRSALQLARLLLSAKGIPE